MEKQNQATNIDISIILPAECLAHIISLTSPQDACRSALVSHNFQLAADSDAVWKRFLPSNYLEIVSSSTASSSSRLTSLSNKELYLHLCNNPILINNGTMNSFLEKQGGKQCYMIGARGLSIVWGDEPNHWTWKPLPDSRFSEVAVLRQVWWLHVKGKIETRILSPKTTYAAYLVFKFSDSKHGFVKKNVELSVKFEGSECGETHNAFLDVPLDVPPENDMTRLPHKRGEGWMEIEMGEFFNENGDDGSVVSTLRERDTYTVEHGVVCFPFANSKHGLIIEGIEFRPKEGR